MAAMKSARRKPQSKRKYFKSRGFSRLFCFSWEQRKLGDIAEFSKGSGYSKGDLIESGTPIILYGRLYTKYETSISEVDTYVEAKDGSVYSKGGEVIVPASGETAEDIARAATVDKSGVILGGDLNVVSPNEDINSAFLAISISHGNSQRELAKKAQGKSVVHIHNEEIKNLAVPFPAKAEQNKIVEYFSNFDNLITLHQRKCDETKKLKKYMLQKMFPQNGSKVPEIRFKGFTDEWEQCKFGEITELKSASRVHKDEWTSNGVPFYRSSDVMAAINGTENEKAFISEELYEKLSKVSGKLEEGDILVTGGGSVGNPYIVPDNKPLYTKDADLLWIKNKGKFHPYFLYEFFFSPTFRNYLESISHVGTIAHYTITQLSDTPICLPSFDEQKEVGEYFQSLDNLITLHQHKCEELKKLKKFMLQNMFI